MSTEAIVIAVWVVGQVAFIVWGAVLAIKTARWNAKMRAEGRHHYVIGPF